MIASQQNTAVQISRLMASNGWICTCVECHAYNELHVSIERNCRLKLMSDTHVWQEHIFLCITVVYSIIYINNMGILFFLHIAAPNYCSTLKYI